MLKTNPEEVLPVTNCTQESFQFPVLKRRIVEANFQGGDITSDGGVLLLQQVDRRLGATPPFVHIYLQTDHAR